MGDVILTFPLAHELKKNISGSEIYYLCSNYTKELIEAHPDITGTINDNYRGTKSIKEYCKLLRKVRNMRFDAVFHCYNEIDYALMMFLALIPYRIGDSSKLAPKLFHNFKVNQDFRNFLNHETDINSNLLKALKIPRPEKAEFNLSEIKAALKSDISKLILTMKKKKTVIIHPGMINGNLPWENEKYRELIELLQKDYQVFLTGGKSEIANNKNISTGLQVIDLSGATSMLDLLQLLKEAHCIISVNTGPMHMAAALGTPVVLLSPTKWIKPNRWGPYGVSLIVEPSKICKTRCNPYNCKTRFCVEDLLVEDVVDAVQKIGELNKKSDIATIKKYMLKFSLNVLNLTTEDLSGACSGFTYFNSADIDSNFLYFIINNDINIIIKNNITFFDRLIRQIAATAIYYPPLFVNLKKTEKLEDKLFSYLQKD